MRERGLKRSERRGNACRIDHALRLTQGVPSEIETVTRHETGQTQRICRFATVFIETHLIRKTALTP
jgi:hypothetical protein